MKNNLFELSIYISREEILNSDVQQLNQHQQNEQ